MLVRLLFGRSEWDRREGKKRGRNEITRGKHSLLARNIIRRAGNRERADESGREARIGRLGNVVCVRARPQTRIFHRILSNFPAIAPAFLVSGAGLWNSVPITNFRKERRCALPIVWLVGAVITQVKPWYNKPAYGILRCFSASRMRWQCLSPLWMRFVDG